MKREDISGIILAGGQSSRMGREKGLLSLGGKLMTEYLIETLSVSTDRIIIISNNPEYKQFDLEVEQDLFPGCGPLGGIYTGLHHSKSNTNLVVSCDVPFVSAHLFAYLLEQSATAEVTVPLHQGRTEQLIGVYSKNCMPVFKKRIEKGLLKVRDANQLLEYHEVLIDDRLPFYNPNIFLNVNSPEDFEKAKKVNKL